MKDLIIWVALWFLIWGILNIYFRWKWEALKSKKYIPRGLFFIISFLIIYYYYYQIVFPFIHFILVSFIMTNVIGLLLSFNKRYYKKFFKDRFFILFQTFNILFQQTAILVAMLLLKKLLGDTYSDIYFGLFFIGIHFALAFLPWVRLKYYILMSCFLGGWLFSYLNFNFQYGIILSFLTHYSLYVWEIFFLKDEEKI